jgi:hypothetical protein
MTKEIIICVLLMWLGSAGVVIMWQRSRITSLEQAKKRRDELQRFIKIDDLQILTLDGGASWHIAMGDPSIGLTIGECAHPATVKWALTEHDVRSARAKLERRIRNRLRRRKLVHTTIEELMEEAGFPAA